MALGADMSDGTPVDGVNHIMIAEDRLAQAIRSHEAEYRGTPYLRRFLFRKIEKGQFPDTDGPDRHVPQGHPMRTETVIFALMERSWAEAAMTAFFSALEGETILPVNRGVRTHDVVVYRLLLFRAPIPASSASAGMSRFPERGSAGTSPAPAQGRTGTPSARRRGGRGASWPAE